jgi:hypothetical protein
VTELADPFTEILPKILVGEKDLERAVLYGKIAWQEVKDCPETQVNDDSGVIWSIYKPFCCFHCILRRILCPSPGGCVYPISNYSQSPLKAHRVLAAFRYKPPVQRFFLPCIHREPSGNGKTSSWIMRKP